MIAPSLATLALFMSADFRPIYTVRIYKSEGSEDPDGQPDYWPGTGLATAFRIFTSSRPAWSNVATLVSEGSLYVDRIDRERLRDLSFKVRGDKDPGGLASPATFSLELDNTDGLFRSFEDAGIRFEGRRLYLLLGAAADTTANGANDVVLFTGRITDVQGAGSDRVTIEAEGYDSAFDCKIPAAVFHNEGDAYEDDVLPSDTVARPIPLVFGDHDQAEGFTVSDAHDTGSDDGGKVVQFVDPNVGAGVYSIVAGRWGDQGLVACSGGFATIVNANVSGVGDLSIWAAGADNASIKFRDFDDYLNLWLTVNLHSWARHLASAQTGTHDERKAIDGDIATATHFDETSSGNSHWIAVYKVPEISIDGNVIFDSDPDPFIYARMTAVAASVPTFTIEGNYRALIVQIQTGKNSRPRATGCYNRRFMSVSSWAYGPGVHYAANRLDDYEGSRPTRANFDALSELSDCWVLLGMVANGSSTLAPACDVYDLGLEALVHIPWPDGGFYANLKGYKDATPSVYTGTAGALIENPAHVLAFLWGACSTGTVADVNVVEHRNVAAGLRSGWKVARQILEVEDLTAVVEELALQSLLWAWRDESGLARVFPMQAVSRGSTTLTLLSSHLPDGELEGYELTPIDEVVTDFVVRYHENPVSGAYDGEVICNETASSSEIDASYVSLCAWASYNNGGQKKKRIFELSWVRDRATAVLIAKKLVVFHSARRYLVTAKLDLLPGALLQVGDSVDFDVEGQSWPASYPRALLAAQYRILEKRLAAGNDLVEILLGQVYE